MKVKKDLVTTIISVLLFFGIAWIIIGKIQESISYRNEEKMQQEGIEQEIQLESEVIEEVQVNLDEYQKLEFDEFDYVDMERRENAHVFTSLSDDSQMIMSFNDDIDIDSIVLDIKEMSVEQVCTQIFYDSESYTTGDSYIEQNMSVGTNIVSFDDASNIKTLRIDLCNESDVVINLNGIYVK